MGPRNGFLLGITTPGSGWKFRLVTGGCRGWSVFSVFRLARTVGKTGSEALLEGRCGVTRLRLPQRLVCAACGIEAASLACGPVP